MRKKTEQRLQFEIDITHWCMSFCKHLITLTYINKAIPTKGKNFTIIPCDMFCSKGQNIESPKRKTTPCKYAEIIDTNQ